MPSKASDLAQTVQAMCPMIPAKGFKISRRFYADLGFQPNMLTDGLAEMSLGAFSFILQDYYVREWADNFVMHMRVSDVAFWWILSLPSVFRLAMGLGRKLPSWKNGT